MTSVRDLLPDLGMRTLVVGIVNVTPDSFSDGGAYFDPASAIAHALRLFSEGADMVDVGGESTRPGAERVTPEEELRRVAPVVAGIRAALPLAPISLDTTRAAVARAGVQAGANLINDISGGALDPEMLAAVASLGVPICLMDLPVLPAQMGWSRAGGGLAAHADAVRHVIQELRSKAAAAEAAGIERASLLIDPGFGFGKSPEQNLAVLREIRAIKEALGGLPLLLGPSRKSTIGKLVGPKQDGADPERVAGTAALVALAAAFGADLVRVHDAGLAARVLLVTDAVTREAQPAP